MRIGTLHLCLHINLRSLAMRKRKNSNYYLDGIGTQFPYIRSFLNLQTYAGAVMKREEHICIYGGNVTESVHFGNKSPRYITKSMMSLSPLLHFCQFYLAPLNHKNQIFSFSSYQLHDSLFPASGNQPLHLP